MTWIRLNQSLHTKTFHVKIAASGSQALFKASLILQIIFFKSLQLHYQMLPKKYKWSFLYTLQQACMVTGQTFPSLISTVILPNVN